MKNKRMLIPIVLIFAMVLGWYNLISSTATQRSEFNNYVKAAESAIKDNIPTVARENIEKALEIEMDTDLVFMLADYYISIEEHDECIDWCEIYFDTNKTDSKFYEYLCKEYYILEDFDSCVALIEQASRGGIMTSSLKELYESIKYEYDESNLSVDKIYSSYCGYALTKNNNMYGIVTSHGEVVVKSKYQSMGAMVEVAEDTYRAIAMDSKGIIWLIDSNGEARVNISSRLEFKERQFVGVGTFNEDVFSVVDDNGVYSLVDYDSNEIICTGYNYIGASVNGRIPVQKNNIWYFIDTKGERTSDNNYESIKVDDYGFAFMNNRAFVKQNGSYIMINENEKQVGNGNFSDAKPFTQSGKIATVCTDGKWSFIDDSGNKKFDLYSNAESFSYGHAAVCINQEWGFIDDEGTLVFEERFDMTNGFASNSSAIVCEDDNWNIINFYVTENL